MGCCGSKAPSDDVLQNPRAVPSIGIPDAYRGSKVAADAQLTVSGEGAAMASAPVEQDAAYWEVKVVKPGAIFIGVARKLSTKELEAGFSRAKDDDEPPRSWVFDGKVEAGDIIGVAFGQSDLPNLSFTKNGKAQPAFDVRKIGGMVYPVVSVGGGAVIKVEFESEEFANSPPHGFSALMVAQSML
jgi:hypothetical protein